MRILVIVGKRGAGKTEFAKRISDRIPVYEMSEYVYREMRIRGINTQDAIKVGEFAKRLREEKGNDIVARLLWEDIKNKELVAVSGARSPEEIEFFRRNADVLVIKVHADPQVRYRRILQRHREGDVTDYETFLKKEALEEALGVNMIKEDIIIDNNSTIEDFERKIKHLVLFII
ncbi:MAG: AAA family ATPase [Candidatus Micrarchaeota archaeon]|nr:AAA family ATPase [Candidatus Micrarchaeota archaeon]